jgi:hypothetical protein
MGGAGTVRIYEGGDRTPTAAQTAVNRNRNSVTAPQLPVYKGASGGTTDGTLIWGADFGGLGIAAGGGASRGDNEIILAESTQYIVDVVSQVASNNIGVEFDWYE